MEIEIRKIVHSNPRLLSSGEKSFQFKVSLKDLKSFVSVPWHISWYTSSESRKVFPPVMQEMSDLNPDYSFARKTLPGYNPFFDHLDFLQYYLALSGGKLVGRVAALVDRNYSEKLFKGKIGIVGLFEAENTSTGRVLIDSALSDLKKEGVEKVIGPMRFSASGEVGLLIDGFSVKPMMMEPYNPPYYSEVFDKIGSKENDWYSFLLDENTIKPYVERIAALKRNGLGLEETITSNGIRIRKVSIDNFQEEVARVKYIYNTVWDTVEHPQFEKFTDKEFAYLANSLKQILVDDFVFIVEEKVNNNYEPIGMSVAIPNVNEIIESVDKRHFKDFKPSQLALGYGDLNRDLTILSEIKKAIRTRKFKSTRIFILGTIRKKGGLDGLLYKKTFENSLMHGIVYSSASQIADTNLNMVNPLLRMGKRAFTWRVYRIL